MSLWRDNGDADATPRPIAAAQGAKQLRLGSDGFCLASATSVLGGLIRAGELQNGINHALQFITDPSHWSRNAPRLNRSAGGVAGFVWPASSSDDPRTDQFATSGNMYEGSLLAIPPSVDVQRLNFRTKNNGTELRILRNIATTFQRCGAAHACMLAPVACCLLFP